MEDHHNLKLKDEVEVFFPFSFHFLRKHTFKHEVSQSACLNP